MVLPMMWNALTFLISGTPPLADIAYFDSCFVQVGTNTSDTSPLTYQQCLDCNSGVPHVPTTHTTKFSIEAWQIGLALVTSGISVLSGLTYACFALRSLQFGELLAYGVYTKVTPLTGPWPSRFVTKLTWLVVFGGYCVLAGWYSVFATQKLIVSLESLAIGHLAGGCYSPVDGVTSNDFVFAVFDSDNPIIKSLNMDTHSIKDFATTYAAAMVVYVPIIITLSSILCAPYASIDAADLFDEKDEGIECGASTASVHNNSNLNHELTVAAIAVESIQHRLEEVALSSAVNIVHREWAMQNGWTSKLTSTLYMWTEYTFMVMWATNNRPEDVALIEKVVSRALELQAEKTSQLDKVT